MDKFLENHGVEEAKKIVIWCAGEPNPNLLEYVPRCAGAYYESQRKSILEDQVTKELIDYIDTALGSCLDRKGVTLRDGNSAGPLNPAWLPKKLQALIEQRPELTIVEGYVKFVDE